MRIFVDTEFTDFIDCDLISIGLAAEDGREFYGERSDFDVASCSEFVRAAVLSQLGRYPDSIFTRPALSQALVAWLSQFDVPSVLCFDQSGDWELTFDLIETLPSGWHAEQINAQLDPARAEVFYREHGGRHHALFDARANRFAIEPGP